MADLAPSPGGPALVLLDGVRWCGVPVPGSRVHALLAALALAPARAVGVDRLVEEVWGADDLPAAPAKALQVLVSRARAATAAEVVVRTPGGYRLGDVDVDAVRLRDRATAARAALGAGDAVSARDRAGAALAVPVGSVGTSGPGPVADLQRDAVEQAATAREVLGRALSRLGAHDEALPLLEAAVARAPGDEGLLADLLTSEATARGVPAALERYERHRARLRDELGSDPAPALRQLHADLLVRDRPVREGLQHDASRLIGREDDVAALSAMIATSRVTTILGAGGLGKTRLAHVMGRLAQQPVVHFVELAGVTSPAGVAVEVGAALGVRDSTATRRLAAAAQRRDLLARMLEQLGTVPVLLVLDNCEHVVEAVAELVAALVARAPQLRVLTTSRAPLGLAAERVHLLPTLTRADGVALFVERATAARPGVRLDEERVGTLVERLDGLPLAVELAAAKVRAMSVEEIERRLENRFTLLRGGSREAPERHQTLLAVIDWSWNLLGAPEKVALRRLAVFRDGFSLAGAGALLDVEDAAPLVTTLVEQSLVTVHEGDALRYRLLETVREFGRMQLVDAGDDRGTGARLRGWASALGESFLAEVFTPGQVDAVRSLRVEEGNLVDVLRRALDEHDVGTVVPVLAALSTLWTIEGAHLRVLDLVAPAGEVLAPAEVPDEVQDALRGLLVAVVTNTMIFNGEPSAWALERLRAVGPGEPSGSFHAQVRLLLRLGAEGRGIMAPGAHDDLLGDPDPAVARLAHQWTSQALENAGDLEGASRAARTALEMTPHDDREGPWTRALLTSQLADLAVQRGDRPAARAYAEAALGPMERLGAVDDEIQLRCLLALVDIGDGHLDEAERRLAEVSLDPRSATVFGGRLVLVSGQAELAIARGRYDEGAALYARAVEEVRATTFPGSPDFPATFAPWVLYPEAVSVAAAVRMGRAPAARATRDGLVTKVASLLEGSGFLDYPVTGSVLHALATWQLAEEGAAGPWRAAVRLLVVADRFSYNRMLPSLAPEPALALAERRCPGLHATTSADLADRPAVELRELAAALVAALDGGDGEDGDGGEDGGP